MVESVITTRFSSTSLIPKKVRRGWYRRRWPFRTPSARWQGVLSPPNDACCRGTSSQFLTRERGIYEELLQERSKVPVDVASRIPAFYDRRGHRRRYFYFASSLTVPVPSPSAPNT